MRCINHEIFQKLKKKATIIIYYFYKNLKLLLPTKLRNKHRGLHTSVTLFNKIEVNS